MQGADARESLETGSLLTIGIAVLGAGILVLLLCGGGIYALARRRG